MVAPPQHIFFRRYFTQENMKEPGQIRLQNCVPCKMKISYTFILADAAGWKKTIYVLRRQYGFFIRLGPATKNEKYVLTCSLIFNNVPDGSV